MDKVNKLKVLYEGRTVGTMALYKNLLAAFEYSKEWIADGFSISPLSLPLEQKVFMPKADPFDGLFGVFADSLPDGWGRLLVDRLMLKKKINPLEIGNLNRLAIVANSGMGALTYEPEYHFELPIPDIELDRIAKECAVILKTVDSDNLDELFRLGGSSGGARPKILTNINGEEWIIKFASSQDDSNIGEQEYKYSLCARECGIKMEETKLFPSKICAGYFGTRRFDRMQYKDKTVKKNHMISVSGLLETSHRIPNLDYNILMKLTMEMTRDYTQIEELYRRMCFNVYAHNRDDHSKNFSYLYDESSELWRLSPAYDLTYSSSIGGEHATTINGNGVDPGIKDLLAVADCVGMNRSKAKEIAQMVEVCVEKFKIRY
ncbi:MAG: type II toxin-antitoxin system HipA family toxin [Lachnospiraceae bacterium]|nr:type II toxin-antitoxin system HipA family toxin [Lachnospiraceae bacterium]